MLAILRCLCLLVPSLFSDPDMSLNIGYDKMTYYVAYFSECSVTET